MSETRSRYDLDHQKFVMFGGMRPPTLGENVWSCGDTRGKRVGDEIDIFTLSKVRDVWMTGTTNT